MEIKNLLVKLANHLDTLGLFEESDSIDSVLAQAINLESIVKTSCIISNINLDGKKILFKNRDRNYKPKIRIYHEIINGVEVAYMKDEITKWCEGMNEFGIGIINSALAVTEDEKQGKFHDTGKGAKATKNSIKDGKRILMALQQKNIKDAVTEISTYLGGLRGHTIVANPKVSYSLEATWRGHDFHIEKLPPLKDSVFTNHGIFYSDAGYTPDKKEDYKSSLERKNKAENIIKKIKNIDDLAPEIYDDRFKNIEDPNNMVRKTKKMRTTSQMILNLDDKEMRLYLIPEEVEYLGYKKNLPEDYDPKISINIFKYKDIAKK